MEKSSKKTHLVIFASTLIVFVAIVYFYCLPNIERNKQLENAKSLTIISEYADALEQFREIKDYKYNEILTFLADRTLNLCYLFEYNELDIFLSTFRNSTLIHEEDWYNRILGSVSQHFYKLCEKQEYSSAVGFIGFLDDTTWFPEADLLQFETHLEYSKAQNAYDTGNYTDAYFQFLSISDYSDSAEKAEKIWDDYKSQFYSLAMNYYQNLQFEMAKSLFAQLDDYKDSAEMLEKIEKWSNIVLEFQDSPWLGEWENKGFHEHRFTRLYIQNDKLCLAIFYGDADKPQDIEELPEGNIIKGYIKKGEAGFYDDGDLVLLSENELQFPYYDGDCHVFVRVGSGLESHYDSIFDKEQKLAPAIGMTAAEVKVSTWGKPKEIKKTTFAWGTTEQWVYSGYRYIFFKDGIVTAISE